MTVTETDKFESKAKSIHGDIYDYSESIYVGMKSPISIKCRKHGEFTILANSHVHGPKPSGCPRCSGRIILTEDFIENAIRIHGDIYNYSDTEYRGSSVKVSIRCPIHGVFEKIPSEHTRLRLGRSPQGCPKCGHSRISRANSDSIDSFRRKAELSHGDKYDYRNVEYSGSKSAVDIICRSHGVFSQNPSSHLSGSGCPECNSLGYFNEGFFRNHPERKNDPALRYIVKLELEGEIFYKIGVTTNTVERRFAGERHIVTILDVLYDSLYACFLDEQELLERNSSMAYTPINRLKGGNTECLSGVLP